MGAVGDEMNEKQRGGSGARRVGAGGVVEVGDER
jgi:hypothetical protein